MNSALNNSEDIYHFSRFLPKNCRLLVHRLKVKQSSTTGWFKIPSSNTKIIYDLENFPLEIKTDSKLKSGEKVDIKFYSSPKESAGGIIFYFTSTLKYRIRRCTMTFDDFENAIYVPKENNKVWRIALSRNSGIRRMVVHCNEVRVLDVVISESLCDDVEGGWASYWSKDVGQIEFESFDTASDLYRRASGQFLTKIEILVLA